MINRDDIEAFEESNAYWDEDYERYLSDDIHDYHEFVESMILTDGKERLAENALGFASEAGELAGKYQKFFRGDGLDRDAVVKEMGDALFYMVAMANAIGVDLYDIIGVNRQKLQSRKSRGVLRGDGDER